MFKCSKAVVGFFSGGGLFVWGPCLAMLRDYIWLCSPESLLVVLGELTIWDAADLILFGNSARQALY